MGERAMRDIHGDLEERAEKQQKTKLNLVPIRPGGCKPPLFWVHGDCTDDFLKAYLDPDQPLYALKHQSRHGEVALYTRVETIAACYLAQLLTVQAEGPYFLGGYSFGGTVAFEMARQLHTKHKSVALLFMIDPVCPGTRLEYPCRAVESYYHHDLLHHLNNIFRLKPQQMLNYVQLRVKGKLKQKALKQKAFLQKILINIYVTIGRPIPYFLRKRYILKIYFDAIVQYAPKPYAGRAVYIKSEQRSGEHVTQWSRLILGRLDQHEVADCDHKNIKKNPYACCWVKTLKACLMWAQEKKQDGSHLI